MGGTAHLSTWIDAETKQRFAVVAARQGLSASAFLKRLVQQALAAGNSDEVAPSVPVQVRDARVTIRLVPEDQVLLRERAAARAMPAATYVSALVRAHLRQVAPLPEKEHSALRLTVNQLAALGRNLNTMTRLMHQEGRPPAPGRDDLQLMLRVCEGIRDHTRALIKANLVSWEVGRDTSGR